MQYFSKKDIMTIKAATQKKQILKTLASFDNIIQGTILTRRHTCGKTNCRCKTHKKYLHVSKQLSFAVEGKTKTITIPKDKVNDVTQGILQYKCFRQQVKRLIELNRNLIKKKPY